LTKSEIAHQFGLQGRDLRDIDSVSDLTPRILVRPSTILVALFDIRLMIQAERVLVVEAQTCTESSTTSIFMYSLERLPLERKYELPFELRILEAALIAVTSAIETDFFAIKESVDKELPDLNIDDNRVQTKLLGFLEHSRRLGTLKKNAGMVHRVINDLLNEDEDLAAMYLTDSKAGQPHSIADHQEVEYLLETYLERAHSIVQSADVMMKNIAKTEETINVVLDAKRNQIMVFEVRLAILTVGLATGTFIAGLFGMNLINYFEDSPWGFGIMTGACIVIISGCSLVLSRLFRQIRRFRIVRI
jgi:magnesium transporter